MKRKEYACKYRYEICMGKRIPKKKPASLLVVKNKIEISIKKSIDDNKIKFCQFCGKVGYVVDKFPRRPYGKKSDQEGDKLNE